MATDNIRIGIEIIKNWILGITVFEEHWLNGHLRSVTEEEGKRMIEKEAKIAF